MEGWCEEGKVRARFVYTNDVCLSLLAVWRPKNRGSLPWYNDSTIKFKKLVFVNQKKEALGKLISFKAAVIGAIDRLPGNERVVMIETCLKVCWKQLIKIGFCACLSVVTPISSETVTPIDAEFSGKVTGTVS